MGAVRAALDPPAARCAPSINWSYRERREGRRPQHPFPGNTARIFCVLFCYAHSTRLPTPHAAIQLGAPSQTRTATRRAIARALP
jgi:hypothetical protein